MTMKINELRFYYGNTNRVGVNYFDSEGTIKAGIDTTEKIINIFEKLGFYTKDIHLAGGINELSHTGDLAYGAVYNDVKAFSDNAYSDYIADREKAEEENKGWLSSYNFEYFFVLFRKNQCDVRFFVRAGKDITIKYDDCIEIATDMNQIIPDISQDVYQNNCLVEGAEIINEMIEELNIANTLEKKQLFLISVEKDTIPLLMSDEIVLIYTEKQKADSCVNKFKENFNSNTIKVAVIQNKPAFIAKMVACGINKFILDGTGKVHKFLDFCDIKLVKNISNPSQIYDEIEDAQPSRRVVSTKPRMTASNISEALKRLPKIHRNRLITAYICGVLSITSSTVIGLFQHRSSPWLGLFPLILIVSIIKGLDSATKVSDKVKEKNPIIARVAMLSLLLHLAAVIIITLLMIIM